LIQLQVQYHPTNEKLVESCNETQSMLEDQEQILGDLQPILLCPRCCTSNRGALGVKAELPVREVQQGDKTPVKWLQSIVCKVKTVMMRFSFGFCLT